MCNQAPAAHHDVSDEATITIVEGWDNFPNGLLNRQDYELDANGVNLWDYYYNNLTQFADANDMLTTLLYHNCVQNQDIN